MAKKKASKPAAKPVAAKQFRVVKSFHSDEFASDYVAGLVYTIRPGNNRLARLVKKWAGESKVEHVDAKLANSSVATGRGGVK